MWILLWITATADFKTTDFLFLLYRICRQICSNKLATNLQQNPHDLEWIWRCRFLCNNTTDSKTVNPDNITNKNEYVAMYFFLVKAYFQVLSNKTWHDLHWVHIIHTGPLTDLRSHYVCNVKLIKVAISQIQHYFRWCTLCHALLISFPVVCCHKAYK